MPDMTDMNEDDDTEGASVSSESESEPEPKKGDDMRSTRDPITGEKVWTQEQRDAFKKIRYDHHETTNDELSGDTIISLAFQNYDQLQKFIGKVGMEDTRMIGIVEIERIFKIDLRGE